MATMSGVTQSTCEFWHTLILLIANDRRNMLYVIVLVLIALYLCGIRNFNYWKKRNIKHEAPIPFFGTNASQFLQQASIAMTATKIYNKYPNEKVVGAYRGNSPELIIRDPDIIKRILLTDFQHFYARGINTHRTVVEPLLKNLFFADGDLWRLMRQRFSPAFSTGKLKAMFPLITERAEWLQVTVEDIVHLESYDARELMARYTTDFIGACGFGIKMDALNDENSDFRKLGKRIFHRTIRDALSGALKVIFPDLCKNLHFLSPELEKTMRLLVKSVFEERDYKPSGRNDFIDMLLELKEKGNIVGESIEQKNPDGSPKIVNLELSDMLMIAQVFVFFGAGFETSSTTSSYTLHQLAFNPDCQRKVQEEIDRVLKKYDNKITYDAINEMRYLEKAFYEAMRMYPSVGYLMRMCTSPEYTFPELDLSITDGVKIIIPIQAIHNDEQYFFNPQEYDPDRFDDARNSKKFVYMPFGEGPRSCVGARLGQMQSMAGIVAVLQKYSLEPAANSVRNPTPEPTAIVAEGFVGGLPLKFKKRTCYQTG